MVIKVYEWSIFLVFLDLQRLICASVTEGLSVYKCCLNQTLTARSEKPAVVGSKHCFSHTLHELCVCVCERLNGCTLVCALYAIRLYTKVILGKRYLSLLATFRPLCSEPIK